MNHVDAFRELVELASLRCRFNALRAAALEFTSEAVEASVPEYRELLRAAVAAAPGSAADRGTAIHNCLEIQRGVRDAATGYAAIATRHLLVSWAGFGEVGGEPYYPSSATLEALLAAVRAAAHANAKLRAAVRANAESGTSEEVFKALEEREFQRVLARAESILTPG